MRVNAVVSPIPVVPDLAARIRTPHLLEHVRGRVKVLHIILYSRTMHRLARMCQNIAHDCYNHKQDLERGRHKAWNPGLVVLRLYCIDLVRV